MQSTSSEQLEIERAQYDEHKRTFEQWKMDNSALKGTPSYEEYVARFLQWESESLKNIQRLEVKRVDNQLDKLLDEATKQQFWLALSKMSAIDKTFSSNLMNSYKRILTAPAPVDARVLRSTAAPSVVQMTAISHPHYVQNLQGVNWQPAAPVKFRVPSPVQTSYNSKMPFSDFSK